MNKVHRFLVVIIICNLTTIDSYCQKAIKDYVQNNFHLIRSIDTSYLDYSDLEPFGDAIGNARVVMLGEQDHGDAPTYLAKTRLIKYLHEKKGFNVLAFEGDFYSLNKGVRQLSSPKTQIANFLKRNIYFFWTACDACSNLFYTYIPGTYSSSVPLQITGFDNQILEPFSINNFTKDLDSLLQTIEIKEGFNDAKRQMIVSTVDSILRWKRTGKGINMDTKNFILPQLNRIDSLISAKSGSHTFWVKAVENLISLINLTPANRDKQMAANLQWLLEYVYPDQKVIVWAANAHIIKHTGGMSKELSSKRARRTSWLYKNMGTDFTNSDNWKRQTYVLVF
jgi:hypothetical protein